jgi:hypothetical protein
VSLLCPLQKGGLATPGFFASVHLAWLNCRFVLSATRRHVIIMWLASLTDAARTAGHSLRASDRGDPAVEQVVDLFTAASEEDREAGLAALVPNTRQLSHMITVMYTVLVKPTLADHTRLAQQTSGYV